jgi:hypothetical protein
MITKYVIFEFIHNTSIEIYMMWSLFILTILVICGRIWYKITDYSETYQFINNL